jgi:cell division transport system permease protein
MLLLGTTMLIFANASRVVHDLGVDTPVTVFMQPDVDPATATALRERIAALPEVARAERVSPEQALARLQTGAGETGERAELLAGIDPGVLPESVEIEFVSGVEPGFADALATRVQGMDGVEEVAVLGPWVQEVERMLTSLRALAIGVALLVSLACLAIVWSTIRLGVFARRSEIQLLRLVGGTARFVRGPFVVEGVVQGVLGTALALTGLWLAFELIRPLLERGMSLLFAAGSLQFFSSVEMAIGLGFGALLGLIGSRAAVARHAEA